MMPVLDWKPARVAATFLVCACSDAVQTPAATTHVPIGTWAAYVDTMPGTYTAVASVVEFDDSVLVVTDVRDNEIWRVNIPDRTRRRIGSRGGGPGEYQSAGRAVRVSRDSLVILSAPPRLPVASVATGTGRTHALWATGTGNDPWTGLRRISTPILQYADTNGHLYGASVARTPERDVRTGRRDLRTAGMLDTIPIIRFGLATQRVDTLAYMNRGVASTPPGRDVDGTMTRAMELGPYGAFNGWLVTAGGQLIIADAAAYTLTIHNGPGTPVVTWRIESEPIAVSESGWMRHVQSTTRGAIAQVDSISRRVFANLGMPAPATPSTRYIVPAMPRTLPRINFGNGARRMHEYGGILWVPVHRVDPPDATHWDLIDLKRGVRIETIVLPANQFLANVAASGAYVVDVDADDLQRIVLYRPIVARVPTPHPRGAR